MWRASKSPRWQQFRHVVGRRGDCLLFFGGLDLVYAWAMWTARPLAIETNSTYQWVSALAPLRSWAVLWACVGVICIWHAFRHYDRFGFVAAIGIKMAWGLTCLIGWSLDDVSLGSVAIWLGLAGLVWRISGWAEPDPFREDEV